MAVRKNIPFEEIMGELRKFYESLEFLLLRDIGDSPHDHQFPLTDNKIESSTERLKKVYQFAVFGDGPDGSWVDGDIYLLGKYLSDADDLLFDLGSSFSKANYKRLGYLHDLYQARISLDGDNGGIHEPKPFLSVKEIALLGCVDERSVRNAISHGDIQASKDGSATSISNAEARRWLSGRRGFKRTVWPSLDMDGLDQVKTIPQFTDYLRARRKDVASSDSIEEFTGDDSRLTADQVKTLEKGEFPWPISICYTFSMYYMVPERVMLRSVMKLFFPEQYVHIS